MIQTKMQRDMTIPEKFLSNLGHPAANLPDRGPIRSDDGQVVVAYHCARRQYLKRSPLPRFWSLLNNNTRRALEASHLAGGKAYVLFLAGQMLFAIPWDALRGFELHQSPKGEGLLVLRDWDDAFYLTGRGKGKRFAIEDFRVRA